MKKFIKSKGFMALMLVLFLLASLAFTCQDGGESHRTPCNYGMYKDTATNLWTCIPEKQFPTPDPTYVATVFKQK